MRSINKSSTACYVALIALALYSCSISQDDSFKNAPKGKNTAASLKTTTFTKSGISFRFPSDWNVMPSDRYAQYVGQMDAEYNASIAFFTMILMPSERGAIMIKKEKTNAPMTIRDMFTRRKEFLKNARNNGSVDSVFAVNMLSDNDSSGSMVDDFTRPSAGRAKSLYLIRGASMVSVSLIVNDRSNFTRIAAAFDTIQSTIILSEEK